MKQLRVLSVACSLSLILVGSVAVLASYSAHTTRQSLTSDEPAQEQVARIDAERSDATLLRDAELNQEPVSVAAVAPETRSSPRPVRDDNLQTSAEANLVGSAVGLNMSKDMLRASNWDQVNAGDLGLQRVPRTHVRFLDPSLGLRGRVTVPGKPEDTLFFEDDYRLDLIQRGRVVRSVKLMPNGTFSFEGLSNGPYGVLLQGRQSMLTYSIYLADRMDLREAGYPAEEIERIYHTQNSRTDELELSYRSCCVLREDYPTVRRLVDEWRRSVPSDDGRHQHLRNLLYIPPEVNLATAVPGTDLCGHRVSLLPNGVLLGQTRKIAFLPEVRKYGVVPAERVDVFVIKGNRIIAEVRTNEEGQFRIENMQPGNYSVVAHSAAPQRDAALPADDPNHVIEFDYFCVIGIETIPWPEHADVPVKPMVNRLTEDHDPELVSILQDENPANQEAPLFLDLGLTELPAEAEEAPFEPAPMAPGYSGATVGGGLGGFIPGLLPGLTPWLFDDDDSSPIAP